MPRLGKVCRGKKGSPRRETLTTKAQRTSRGTTGYAARGNWKMALHDCEMALHDCEMALHDCEMALHDCEMTLHDCEMALHD